MPENKTEKTIEQRVADLEKVSEAAVTIAKKIAAVLYRQFGIKILAFAVCAFMAMPVMAVDTLFDPVGTAYSGATAKIIVQSQSGTATMKVDNVVSTYGYFTDVTVSGTLTSSGVVSSSNRNMKVFCSNIVDVGTIEVTGAATLSSTLDVGANVNITGAITNSGATRSGSLATTGTVTATVGVIGGYGTFNGAVVAGGGATVSNLCTVGALASTGTVTGTVGGSFGGLVLGYVAKTNGYAPTVTDHVMVHTAGFEYTNTLADANTMLGRVFVITSADGTKDIYVNTDGTDTIQGSNKQAILADTGDSITIQATGAHVWTVIQNTGVTFGAIP